MRSKPDAATLRKLAVVHLVDPRTICRELNAPGSVKGMTGDRARAAVAELRALTENANARRTG